MKRNVGLILIIISLLTACSTTVNNTPDFQSSFLPYFNEDANEEVILAIVDDNITEEERGNFIFPKEWEVYRIHIKDETTFINANGEKIKKEEFEMHDYKFNVWTSEKFQPAWTDVLTDDSNQLVIDHIPSYTAKKIQIVDMTDKEYLALDYAQKEGEYHLQIFVGDGFNDEESNLIIQDEVWNAIDLGKSKIKSVGFSERPSKRKEELLEIQEYPSFFLYDHEKLLLKTAHLEGILEYLSNNDN
ncbi:MAG: hypothetical protein LPK26_18655 [Bacillaceae bacterium]|nr:hypothetical protein [Bacillaceae bacterium]